MRPVANESKIPPGTLLIGKYRVTREIGRGGMAAVYEAEQTSLGKKVAVKVLAAELAASTIVIERFFREARAAASVRSPYIVDVYDSGRLEDGRPFICMELLEGESLYDRMARIRLIDPETTVRVINHSAKALTKAHAAGIVHRDLKPENIFLMKPQDDGEEIAKLLDFGLAKFYAPVAADEKTARLTREGAVFGTPAYMSPEQVKGQGSVDHRADLWALGCLAFECLIGRPVWNTDQGVAMTFAAIATSPIPVPSTLRPDLPEAFDEWFKKALQRDPDKRFQSARELSDALTLAFGKPSVSMLAVTEISQVEKLAVGDGREESSARHIDLVPSSLRAQLEKGDASTSGSGLRQLASAQGDGGNPSATDVPPTARNSQLTGSQITQLPPSPLRWAISSIALAGSSVLAFVVWSNVLRPQVVTPLVMSTATTVPTPGSSGAVEPPPAADEPKWLTAIGDGQKLFASGDAVGALKKFKDAQDMGSGPMGKVFADQIKIAQAATGTCKMVAFSHPRISVAGGIGRPSVASNAKGAIVTWTDDHEQAGHDHAYSVVIDEAGRPLSRPRDLTPEAGEVMRPVLLSVAERTVLLYSDKSGREAGVRVRWLDGDGRIAGGSILVGAARPGNYWPAIDKSPDGFYVAWQDDRDREGDDLFLRKLSAELEPVGAELRATDYASIGGRVVNVRVPSVAVASNAVFIAYKLEREPLHLIDRLRIALNSPDLTKGLEERGAAGPNNKGIDRELGNVELVNEDKTPGDAPTIACGSEGCFLAWHGEKGGAYAALIEPVQGRVLWRKKFAEKGTHPGLATSPTGAVAIVFFEAGRVKTALLSRDGVGASSVIAKVTGDQPRAWIASGRTKGEWLVSWQDFEAAHTEAYVARVACRM